MKKMVSLMLSILALFFIVDRITFATLSHMDKNIFSGQLIGKVNHFFKIKDSVELIIFGNSRANHHINNDQFNLTSFNIGIDGSNLFYHKLLSSTLTKKNQLVILVLDPWDLSNNEAEPSPILFLSNLFYRHEKIRSTFTKYFPTKSKLYLFSKSYTYNGKVFGVLKNYFLPKYNFKSYNGYDPLFVSKSQKLIFEKMINLNKSRQSIYEGAIQPAPEIKALLESIKENCEKNNSRLVILSTPYYNGISKSTKNSVSLFFEDLSIEYFNYSNYFLENNDKSYWKDFGHLSNEGATLFTRALMKDLLIN